MQLLRCSGQVVKCLEITNIGRSIMLAFINASVIFAFGLVITGIVFLGVMQARDQELRPLEAKNPGRRASQRASEAA